MLTDIKCRKIEYLQQLQPYFQFLPSKRVIYSSHVMYQNVQHEQENQLLQKHYTAYHKLCKLGHVTSGSVSATKAVWKLLQATGNDLPSLFILKGKL